MNLIIAGITAVLIAVIIHEFIQLYKLLDDDGETEDQEEK